MYREVLSKVAGVTFNNPDGENRQALLASLCPTDDVQYIEVLLIPCIFHNDETGEDEDALRVYEHHTMKQIGWIPRADIEKMSKYERTTLTCRIAQYQGLYGCQLYEQVPPTKAMYGKLKSIQRELQFPNPVYDYNAYQALIKRYSN